MRDQGFQDTSISVAYFISIFILVIRNWRLTAISSGWNHRRTCSNCGREMYSAIRLLIILVYGMLTAVRLYQEESAIVLPVLPGLLVKRCRLFPALILIMN